MAPQGLKTEFWSSENWAYNAQTVRTPLIRPQGHVNSEVTDPIQPEFELF